jgi:hypothetical protein
MNWTNQPFGMGNKSVRATAPTPEEIHAEISKNNLIFEQEMNKIEIKSKKQLLKQQYFGDHRLKGNSNFILTKFYNLSECNAIECFSAIEDHFKVLYLPKDFSSEYFDIRWTNKNEIFYYSEVTAGIHYFSLKIMDLNSKNSKEFHSSNEYPESNFSEFQCEILHHYAETDYVYEMNIIKNTLFVLNPRGKYRTFDLNSKKIINLHQTDLEMGQLKITTKSNYCMTKYFKKGNNILDLETSIIYSLEGLGDISQNGKLAVSIKNRMVEIYEMQRIKDKKNINSFQSFEFFEPVSSLTFSEDSNFLIFLSYRAIPSEVGFTLSIQYYVSIYSIKDRCLFFRFPYRNPRQQSTFANVLNIGKYLFIQSKAKGVDVMEINFVKNVPSGYLDHLQDVQFKFK